MSFRNTYVTEFLYRATDKEGLNELAKILAQYGTVNWEGKGQEGLGYFHGIIKDSNGDDTKQDKERIEKFIFEKTGARVSIIIEQ